MPAEVSATERARWLAELADALEEAQKLAWEIGQSENQSAQAMDLYGRLETVRLEVRAIRVSRSDRNRADFNPEWTEYSPWSDPTAGGTG